MELEHYQSVALYGFAGAMIYGVIASRTQFCTMGAVSDWVNMGSKTRFRVWMLAMGIAVLMAQIMQSFGLVDFANSIYLSPNFAWVGHIVGGIVFGIGMTLSSGCGQRTLVRVGGGNLKSIVVLLIMGITAYMTLRGLFALIRLEISQLAVLDLANKGIATQSMPDILGNALGISSEISTVIVTLLIGGGAVFYALKEKAVYLSFDNLLAGLGIGLLVAGSWYATGVLGFDDFEPIPLEGLSFIAPSGNLLSYLMTYTGSVINFGIAVVIGIICGAFLYSLFTGSFRVEGFGDKQDMINHMTGAMMMGFGGVLGLGCTIGQGVTGMSTLAVGSLLTLISIILGCAATLKMQYYLYDEKGWGHAIKSTFCDLIPSKS